MDAGGGAGDSREGPGMDGRRREEFKQATPVGWSEPGWPNGKAHAWKACSLTGFRVQIPVLAFFLKVEVSVESANRNDILLCCSDCRAWFCEVLSLVSVGSCRLRGCCSSNRGGGRCGGLGCWGNKPPVIGRVEVRSCCWWLR